MSATARSNFQGARLPTAMLSAADGDYRRLSSRLSLADFLWNGPTGGAATTGDTKSTFLEHLGLNDTDLYHRHLFSKMKEEASIGRQNLLKQPPQLWMVDPTGLSMAIGVKDIREDAFAEVMKQIYRTASPETRTIYDLVGSEQDNWVIRWMLWHIFKDSVLSTPLFEKAGETMEEQRSIDVAIKQELSADDLVHTRRGKKHDYFDPVRNR